MSTLNRTYAEYSNTTHMVLSAGYDQEVQGHFYSNQSTEGRSLIRNIDGSLVQIPKTIAEVAGERILRPLLDTAYTLSTRSFSIMQGGLSLLDEISRKINFLPVVAAQSQKRPDNEPTELERCLSVPLAESFKSTTVAASTNDPELLLAADQFFGRFFDHCFDEQSFHRNKKLHDSFMLTHSKEKAEHEKKLKDCEKAYRAENCYPYNVAERLPDIFLAEKKHVGNDQVVTTKEWAVTQGYLSWSIYVDNWIKDSLYASGGYNYDKSKGTPTVMYRDEI